MKRIREIEDKYKYRMNTQGAGGATGGKSSHRDGSNNQKL
jgi:hypothetical protein